MLYYGLARTLPSWDGPSGRTTEQSAGQSVVQQPGALRVVVLSPACRVVVQQGARSGLPEVSGRKGGLGWGRLKGRPAARYQNTKINAKTNQASLQSFAASQRSPYLARCDGAPFDVRPKLFKCRPRRVPDPHPCETGRRGHDRDGVPDPPL